MNELSIMEHPNRLYELRNSLRKSQSQMANVLDISQSEYSRLEKGKRRLGVHQISLKKYFIKHNAITESENIDINNDVPSNENIQQFKEKFAKDFEGKVIDYIRFLMSEYK